MLNGVDISKWQGEIDWAKMQQQYEADNIDFVIIRAGSIDNTTGICYTDYQFENNVAGAKASGIPSAFYWFFRPNWSPTVQAAYFTSLVDGKYCPDIAVDLWCDIEVAGRSEAVFTFCDLCVDHGATGVYTSPNTALYLLTGNKGPLAVFPLWLADWSPPANVPDPWTEWLLWQYAVTQDGLTYGCKSYGLDVPPW